MGNAPGRREIFVEYLSSDRYAAVIAHSGRRIQVSINKAKAANGTPDQQRELLVASQRKAQQAWQRLWMRIQSITPSGLLRFLLMVIALAGLIWLIASTFQSLAAFVIASQFGLIWLF